MTARTTRQDALRAARLAMLHGRTWRYLRYVHLRDYVGRIADQIETVCFVGAGHGVAELAIAIEYSHLQVWLTDIVGAGYPNYHQAMSLSWRYSIDNVHFSIWDVLTPAPRQFDLIGSTEVLEHIEDAAAAAAQMRAAARRYVYCLVPFADAATNADPARRQQAWERHEHHVYGYDAEGLRQLFPGRGLIAGTYWRHTGQPFRERLEKLPADDIRAGWQQLHSDALADLSPKIPEKTAEAAGIKILWQVPAAAAQRR